MDSGVYEITNLITGMRYVGSSLHLADRLYKHRNMLTNNYHDNIHLQRSWNKHSCENFRFSIIEHCENYKEREQALFDEYIKEGKWKTHLYNISKDATHPTAGQKLSEAHKIAIGNGVRGKDNGMYGRKRTDAVKKAVSDANTGKVRTKAFRANLSKKNKGSNNPNAKLTESDVLEIRARFREGGISRKELAKDYPVGVLSISSIIAYRTWKHLSQAEEVS